MAICTPSATIPIFQMGKFLYRPFYDYSSDRPGKFPRATRTRQGSRTSCTRGQEKVPHVELRRNLGSDRPRHGQGYRSRRGQDSSRPTSQGHKTTVKISGRMREIAENFVFWLVLCFISAPFSFPHYFFLFSSLEHPVRCYLIERVFSHLT